MAANAGAAGTTMEAWMSKELIISEDDHLRGSRNAAVTLIEYADFQCPFCARAHAALTELQGRHGERLALVFRHLPLADKHPFAEAAAEAAEAAGAQGKFWEMHDLLFANQDKLDAGALSAIADTLGLDVDRFDDEVENARYRDRVDLHADQARALGADRTPTFFINGERYEGDSDHASLSAAIDKALGAA